MTNSISRLVTCLILLKPCRKANKRGEYSPVSQDAKHAEDQDTCIVLKKSFDDIIHCETASTTISIADGVVAVLDSSSESVEVLDLSFDLEAATKFEDFNTQDLGTQHTTSNVKKCKSKICNVRQKKGNGVCFVKSNSKTMAMF